MSGHERSPGLSSPAPHRLGMVEHTHTTKCWEVRLTGAEAQGRFWLYSVLEANLGYARPCQKEKEELQEEINPGGRCSGSGSVATNICH